MSKVPIVITENHGGLASDLKQGTRHSFAYSRHIDFRKSPTSLTVLPRTVKESGSVVIGLVADMIRMPSGKLYAVDLNGRVYQRTTAGVWTNLGSVTDFAHGLTYNLQFDVVYISGLTSIHAITNADGRFSGGSVTLNSNYITTNIDQQASEATDYANSVDAAAFIDHGSSKQKTFIPTIEPLTSIDVYIKTKSTGALTLTLHDQANNVLGTVTKANVDIIPDSWNSFTFATPVRTTVAPNQTEFHYHLTYSTGSATTIGTATTGVLEDSAFRTYVGRLTTNINAMHPMAQFLQYIVVGNGRYLSAWEVIEQVAPTNLSYRRHQLVFPTGYEVTSMATWTEYLAIAVEKRSSSATDEFQDGRIYFWDGVSLNYNFQIAVPEGSPYSLFSHKNVLYWIAAGALWAWSGGDPIKIFQFPNTDFEYSNIENYIVNYPNMLTVRNSILMAGFPSETSSTTIEHGIYSYGARNKNYANSFGYSYAVSVGTRDNSDGTIHRIGMVKSFGDKMFMSWRSGSTYGVDVVDSNSDAYANSVWESLIIDLGRADKTKQAVSFRIDYAAMPSGIEITPKYKIDRGNWVLGDPGVGGTTEITLNINKRFKEIQVGFNITCTDVTPTIISSTLIVETLQDERD